MKTPNSSEFSECKQARPESRQAKKSQSTREKIMQASVRCLVQLGYTRTLTQTIADEARLSRGALMHHFNSSAEVFRAVAEYLVSQRSIELEQLTAQLLQLRADRLEFEELQAIIFQVFRFYASPMHLALNELKWAARGDSTISRTLALAVKRLDQSLVTVLGAALPKAVEIDQADATVELIVLALQGAAQDSIYMKDSRRIGELVAKLAQMVYRELNK